LFYYNSCNYKFSRLYNLGRLLNGLYQSLGFISTRSKVCKTFWDSCC